jgi:predicted transcriptional regulator
MREGGFVFWGFKAPREFVRSALGTLEQQVIDIVWRRGQVSVREVHDELEQPTAYTTVMTTLDRLYRKGLLTRTKSSRAFVYEAVKSRQELEEIVATEIMSGLLSGERAVPHPLLSNFVDVIGDRDRDLLDELERLVKAKRRRLEEEGDV